MYHRQGKYLFSFNILTNTSKCHFLSIFSIEKLKAKEKLKPLRYVGEPEPCLFCFSLGRLV